MTNDIAPDAPTADIDVLINTIRYICVKSGVAETTMGAICHQVRHSNLERDRAAAVEHSTQERQRALDAERQRNALQARIDAAGAELPPEPLTLGDYQVGSQDTVVLLRDYNYLHQSATLAIAKERQRAEAAEARIDAIYDHLAEEADVSPARGEPT